MFTCKRQLQNSGTAVVYWLQIYPLTSDIQKAEHLLSFQGSMVKQKPHKALLT